jgi:hypothetical protein
MYLSRLSDQWYEGDYMSFLHTSALDTLLTKGIVEIIYFPPCFSYRHLPDQGCEGDFFLFPSYFNSWCFPDRGMDDIKHKDTYTFPTKGMKEIYIFSSYCNSGHLLTRCMEKIRSFLHVSIPSTLQL